MGLNELPPEATISDSDGAGCSDLECFDVIREGSHPSCTQTTTQVVEVLEPPKVGLKFEKVTQLIDYYTEYGRQNGFQSRIESMERIKKKPSVEAPNVPAEYGDDASKIRLRCSKGGTFRSVSKNPKANTKTIKTDCKARVNANRGAADGMWKITTVNLEHNHPVCREDVRFMSGHRRIDNADKRRLMTNDTAGIPISKNYAAFAVDYEGWTNVPFKEKDLRNALYRARRIFLEKGDAVAMRKLFDELGRHCPDFFYVIDTDDDGVLRNVFWADARCRAAYKDFGDVISFDATYLKNRYKMPFAAFIGVNHHGQSTLLGCALISSEDADTYVWLFEQYLRCMGGKAPSAILTDQCAAMG